MAANDSAHIGRGAGREHRAARERAADPARPPAASRESEVRLRVLQAAVALVDRLSYNEVTMDAVARASGVSRATLYRHWSSRQSLVLDAFTYKTNLLMRVEDTGDVRRDLHTYLVALTRCLNDGETASTVGNLLAEAIRNDEFSRLYRQTLLGERRQGFLVILRQGQLRGQIRTDADLGVAVDAMYGAIYHRLVGTRDPIDASFLRQLNALILLGSATKDYLRPEDRSS